MAKDSMTFSLFGRDVSLSKTLKTAGKNAGKFGKDGSKALGGIAMAGAGLAGAGLAAAAFAGKSIGAFQQVGGESLKLQRYMGGTIEDASRLGHVAAMTGIDSESMAKSMGILSKNLASNSKVAKGIGIDYRDAHNRLLPMSQILPQLADKFAKMPAGPRKTALALKLFGKQGMNMLPMLNKGSEGIKALAAESDALGTTLNDKDAQAVKDATLNKRKMSEAIKGLQISIGKNLLPIVQQFVTWMTTKVVPAIKDVVGFLERNKAVVATVAAVLVPLVGGLFAFVKVMQVVAAVTKAWAVAQLLLNSAVLANPLTWVVIGIVALVAAIVIAYKRSQTFRNVVQGALRAVGAAFVWLKDKAVAAFNWIKTKGWDFLVMVIKNSPLGLQVRAAFAAFRWLRDNIGKAVSWIRGKWDGVVTFFSNLPGRILATLKGLPSSLIQSGRDMIQGLLNGAGEILPKVGQFFLNKLPGWIREPFKKALGIASPSKVFFEYGKNTLDGYIQGLQPDRVKKAMAALGTVMAQSAKAVLDRLKATAQAGLDFKSQIAQGALEFGKLSEGTGDGPVTSKSMIGDLQSRLNAIRNFTTNLRKLKSMGLSGSLLRQLLDAGPESGGKMADALVKGGIGDVKKANSLNYRLGRASAMLGEQGMRSVYGFGSGDARATLRARATVQETHFHFHGSVIGGNDAAGREIVALIRKQAAKGNKLVPA